MTDAFTSEADFSGIASLEKMRIDAIVHKTFIKVDEQGTEAAAVTAVPFGALAMAAPAAGDPVPGGSSVCVCDPPPPNRRDPFHGAGDPAGVTAWKTFAKVNCAALPSDPREADLFAALAEDTFRG